MKRIIEVLKKEPGTEYVIVLVAMFVYLCVVFGETLGSIFGAFIEITVEIVPDPYFSILISICIATLIAIPTYFVVKRDEEVLDLTQKDEREIQHEYAISHTGYRVLVTLIGIYWLWNDMFNPWLVGIIATTLLFRLGHRMILEYSE